MSVAVSVPESSLEEIVRGLEETRTARLARVSRVLHDDVGPLLCALGLQLGLLAGKHAAEIQQQLEQAIEKVRRLSYFAHENLAGRFGLARAFEHFPEFADPRYRGQVHIHLLETPDVAPSRAQLVLDTACDALWLLSQSPGTTEIHVTLTQGEIELRSDADLESAALLQYRAARSALSVEIDAQTSSTRISIHS